MRKEENKLKAHVTVMACWNGKSIQAFTAKMVDFLQALSSYKYKFSRFLYIYTLVCHTGSTWQHLQYLILKLAIFFSIKFTACVINSCEGINQG